MVSLTIRSTWRPFGPEPFGCEPFGSELKAELLRVERLKAEGLSTGSRNLPAPIVSGQAGMRITVNPEPDNLSYQFFYYIAKKIVGQCSNPGSTPGTPCKQMQ